MDNLLSKKQMELQNILSVPWNMKHEVSILFFFNFNSRNLAGKPRGLDERI